MLCRLLYDSSVDAGHVKLKLFLVSYYDTISLYGKVHVHNKFLCAQHLKRGTGREYYLNLFARQFSI